MCPTRRPPCRSPARQSVRAMLCSSRDRTQLGSPRSSKRWRVGWTDVSLDRRTAWLSELPEPLPVYHLPRRRGDLHGAEGDIPEEVQEAQPAHRGRAALGEVRKRTVVADRLPLALADAQ